MGPGCRARGMDGRAGRNGGAAARGVPISVGSSWLSMSARWRCGSSGSASAGRSSTHQLINGALLLFAFFMISDPMTIAEPSAGARVHAALVAAIAFAWQFGFYAPTGCSGRCSSPPRWCRCGTCCGRRRNLIGSQQGSINEGGINGTDDIRKSAAASAEASARASTHRGESSVADAGARRAAAAMFALIARRLRRARFADFTSARPTATFQPCVAGRDGARMATRPCSA